MKDEGAEKDVGGRMKEGLEMIFYTFFILHPSSFILHFIGVTTTFRNQTFP
jgi:hypothetical protein